MCFANCFKKSKVSQFILRFHYVLPFSNKSKKYFWMFCHTFQSTSVGIFQILDVIRHTNWFGLVFRALKLLFLANC